MPQQKSSFGTRVMVVFLIIAAGVIGYQYAKLQNLQNNNIPSQTPTAQTTTTPGQPARTAFINYAKQLNLDTNKFAACLDEHQHKTDVANDLSDGQKVGINGTPTFYINGLQLVGAYPYATFKLVIDHELSGSSDPFPSTVPVQTTSRATVGMGNLPILGNQNAPVTIIEFSDFQCPFCQSFFQNTYSQLKKDYIDSGKVKLVYRTFPLTTIHPNAQGSAEAAECANDQGKFWDMHNIFFQNQNAWSNDTPVAGT